MTKIKAERKKKGFGDETLTMKLVLEHPDLDWISIQDLAHRKGFNPIKSIYARLHKYEIKEEIKKKRTYTRGATSACQIFIKNNPNINKTDYMNSEELSWVPEGTKSRQWGYHVLFVKLKTQEKHASRPHIKKITKQGGLF